jgi:hypothetical protein
MSNLKPEFKMTYNIGRWTMQEDQAFKEAVLKHKKSITAELVK